MDNLIDLLEVIFLGIVSIIFAALMVLITLSPLMLIAAIVWLLFG